MAKDTKKRSKAAQKAATGKKAPPAKEKEVENIIDKISSEEIIKMAAAAKEMTIKDVKEAYNGVVDAICASLGKGLKVQMTGFVTFQPVYRSARTANNVFTGEPMDVPESLSVGAKAGTQLKTAIAELDPVDFRK